MPRAMTPALIAAFTQQVVRPYRAFKIEFPSMTLRVWSGLNTRTINGEVYIGGGIALAFGEVEETSQIEATGTKIIMSGIDSSIISLALSENYEGAPVTLYLGEHSTIDLIEMGSGTLDQMLIDDDTGTCTITANVENILIDLERPRVLRYTHEDQQLLHPGDMIFEFVADIQNKEINWS